ncbi:U3 small nucleolar RNA-associated protein 14 like protein A [Fukomys damarensis]|uniref:U3 small nucleolar RNA-associated protein 14 like protein A n=2 Tax=Fukomys damarensis TaxID=885580 RepID=A0A091DRC7_FUKDA|nr:U3 small nucleolar RNA-associated protein 14 like protein A [Fukomys damarensis]
MNVTQAMQDLLPLNQQEELVDLPNNYPLSASEDERDSDGERKHQKLLEAIVSLDEKNRWKLAERTEACLKISELNVSAEGSGEKLVLSDLLKPGRTSSSLAAMKKQLNRVKFRKTLVLPFNKKEIEQIYREVAFNKASQTLSKWDPIVLKNRQAEQLLFPLEKEQSAFVHNELVFSGCKARTPLEQEVFNLLHKNKQPVTDPLLDPMEKASFKAMSLEEAKMHRAELQRARALQSYYEAKAQREKKIKSKKFHRFVKKKKANKTLKDFDQLCKVNPTVALDELEKTEKTRMMERMSLKHQNSGKWVRSKINMARYDLEARQAVQKQLAKNKELTEKLQVISESEDEERGAKEEDPLVLDLVNEIQMCADGPNPWMLRNCNSNTKKDEIQTFPVQVPEPVVQKFSKSEEDERSAAEEENFLEEFEERQSFGKRFQLNQETKPVGSQETKDSSSQDILYKLRALNQKFNKENHYSRKQTVSQAGTILQGQREESALEEEEFLLLQRPERIQILEELEDLGKEGYFQNKELPRPLLKWEQMKRNPNNQTDAPKEQKKEQMIDLQNFLTTKSPSVKSLAFPTAIEELEDEEERNLKQMIKEAFAGDDVIRDFLKEKKEAVEANKPNDVDLKLPGWGKWGGVGLKLNAKKGHRFLIKAPEGPPRKDKNLPNVIISEKRNICAAAHQVQVLPYPFTHYQQFERTIQTPIGSSWNTQRAFQKLTTPKIVTKPGHIIKPIKAEDVGCLSSSRLDLSVIQSITAQPTGNHKKQLKKTFVD